MPDSKPIKFYNRYTNRVEEESVYGESWLRWAYGNPLGKLATRLFIARALFSKWYGSRMKSAGSKSKIEPFIRDYNVDTSEFAESIESFASFNDFFKRELKDSARPIKNDESCVVFPADGRHIVIEDLSEMKGLYVKGQKFNLGEFLDDPELLEEFKDGSLIVSRLCPVDYHHFHFPIAGIPSEVRQLPGPLYSVNPISLRRSLEHLFGNYRNLTVLKDTAAGKVLVMEVGATNIGSIVQDFEANIPTVRGARKGWFEFGGSSVVTLFKKGKVRFSDDLKKNSSEQLEVYAKMGDTMAEIR